MKSFVRRLGCGPCPSKGFTLIEILVVIGIIAILAAVVLIAINPARHFSQANNTVRRANVETIANAIGHYMADHKGALPTLPASATEICKTGVGSCGSLVNLSALTADGIYLPNLPIDPTCPTGLPACDPNGIGYTIFKSTNNNRITVSAPQAELGETISITR